MIDLGSVKLQEYVLSLTSSRSSGKEEHIKGRERGLTHRSIPCEVPLVGGGRLEGQYVHMRTWKDPACFLRSYKLGKAR